MSTKIEYTPLTGGLDVISGALNVKPGRMSDCLNFEQVFGKQGYRRIDGYERYDGRAEPHKASYYVMRFTEGATVIAPGDVVTNGGASAEVLLVEVESGEWADGDAAGRLMLILPFGSFTAGTMLQVSLSDVARIDGSVAVGGIYEPLNDTYLALARETLRADIQKVPGSGSILGVAVYRGEVYAARNAADGKTAALYRSSSGGWVLVRAGLLPGGRFRFDVANFSGSSKTVTLFGVDGKNRPFKWDGTTFTPMAPIYGSQGSSSTAVAVGTGAKNFTIVESARSWAVGQQLIAHSTANAANRMVGTVTSYAGTALALNVTEAEGSGLPSDWEIASADFTDKPYLVADHRDHLFLAYPLGQLQTSNLGDPMTYTSTAALFGVGDEITGLASMKGAVMGVFCLNKISVLSGASAMDWAMEMYSQSAGAKRDTVQEMSGNALFLDDRGLTSLQATQNFGDFEPSIFSRDIKPLLDVFTPSVIGSRLAKTKFQYRLYTENGTRLTATILTPEAAVRPQDVAFTRQQYADLPTCTAHGDMDDGSEGLFFGTTDGYVMREDVGVSFDGKPISAVMRLHFNQLKSPSNKKRFRKLEMELDAPDTVAIKFRQQFDYADGTYASGLTNEAIAIGAGGQWGVSGWDQFYWSLPIATQAEANIDGVGRNMGLLIWHESAFDQSFTLQGLLLQYSIMGLAR